METICGANCERCSFKSSCRGCAATCGKPFGGDCVAAEYIKAQGKEKYTQFKTALLKEINALLKAYSIPEADALHELPGSFVNLEYPISGDASVKMLDDKRVYLGCQVTAAEPGVCYGAVADTGFILLSRYREGGSDPELILYKKRY